MNRYTFNVTAKCPANGHRDWYVATVTTDCFLLAEDIEAAVEACVGSVAYQEELTARLSDALGVPVVLCGQHYGVSVTSGEVTP